MAGSLAIVAGSDTTAGALAGLFYLLLSDKDAYKRLQTEIDGVFPEGENAFNVSKHSKLPFLTACMYVSIHYFMLANPEYLCLPETRRLDYIHRFQLMAQDRSPLGREGE